MERTATNEEPGRLAMPRSRGAMSGLLLVILGAWGALAPFVGPYFDWVIGSDLAWDFTAGRFWLNIVPGAAVALGGLLLLRSANRATGAFGAWLAMAGGAWFCVGPVTSMLWNGGTPQTGDPLGGTNQQVAEWLTYHYALGAMIIGIAAFAFGKVTTRGIRDVERLTPATDEERIERTGRFRRHKPATVAADEQTAVHSRQEDDRAAIRM